MSSTVSAAPLPLPQGARWLIAAPRADRLAHDASATLTSAGSQSPIISVHRTGSQLRRSLGLPVVDADALAAAGVDLAQPWLLFERAGGTYLSVGVKDAGALGRALDLWATERQLKQRDAETLKAPHAGAIQVTFSRAAGTRAAAGYLIAKGRAIILVNPAERTSGLVAAYESVEGGAPVEPPVSGSLLLWTGPEVPFHDGWLAFSFRTDGVDLTGSARKVDAGWLVRDKTHAAWIRSLTAAPDGAPADPPAWARVTAGPKAVDAILNSIAPLLGDSSGSMSKWVKKLGSVAVGPLEAIARTVDASALQEGSTGDFRTDLLALTKPQVALVDRPGAVIADRLASAAAELCHAQKDGEDTVRSHCEGSTVTVTRRGQTLTVGWGDAEKAGPELPALTAGEPSLSCASGTPVASARIELASVSQGTKGVGLMDALSNETLAGLYAVGLEYGSFMRVARPAIGLVCEETSGKVTVVGRWRFSHR